MVHPGVSLTRANALYARARGKVSGGTVKTSLFLFGVMSGVLWTGLSADAKAVVEQGYQTATVVSVERHQPVSNYLGENPSDAPLRAREYAYDIGLRLDCDVYVGRYQSATNYLPSSFAANQTVDVRLHKHVFYVSLPYSDWDVKMSIVRHRRVKDESCARPGL
jgi:hypothetical protein